MVGSPLGVKCQMNGSICCEVVEKHSEGQLLTPVSAVGRYPVLSSKKGAQILKKNPSHGLNTKFLSGKEAECTRDLRSTETRKRSSFSSPTFSSSRKIRHKVQVQKIQPRFKKDSASEAMKTSQEKDTRVPSRPSLLIPEKMKMISAPPHFLQKITPIRTSIHPSQPTTTHTKSSTPLRTSSNPQLLHQKTQNKAPVFQSKIHKSPTSQPLQKRICNQNSVSQSGPSKQYVSRRSGNQKTLVPSWALEGKTRLPTSIRQSKSSTSTNKFSRIRERCWGDEEPIHHISWEGLNETIHPWGITCPLCENDLSDMPYGYSNEYTDEYHDDVEPSVLPSVAILSCGHSFHAACLDGITPEESSSDPSCIFCLSCID